MEKMEFLMAQDKSIILLYFFLFLVLCLLVWVIAELKNMTLTYEHSEEEKEGWHEMEEHRADHELNIRDILHNSTFRGFKAI